MPPRKDSGRAFGTSAVKAKVLALLTKGRRGTLPWADMAVLVLVEVLVGVAVGMAAAATEGVAPGMGVAAVRVAPVVEEVKRAARGEPVGLDAVALRERAGDVGRGESVAASAETEALVLGVPNCVVIVLALRSPLEAAEAQTAATEGL